MLITFEGIDKAGKTTQLDRIYHILEKNYPKKVLKTKEPSDCFFGNKISELTKSKNYPKTSFSDTLLFMSNRHLNWENSIKHALKNDYIVLCDRFIDSTMVYQHFANDNPCCLDIIKDMHNLATNNTWPDLTFIFDIDVDEYEKRLESNDDYYETSDLSLVKRRRDAFLALSFTDPRYVIVNGKAPVNDITDIIKDSIKEKLNDFKRRVN